MSSIPALTPGERGAAEPETAPVLTIDPGTGTFLRRPRLLMSAARLGLGDYRRTRDLLRLLGYCPSAAVAVLDLSEMEATAEAARRAGSPAWSCTRHVEVLIALLAERAITGG